MNPKHFLSVDIDYWVKDTDSMMTSLLSLMNSKGDIPLIAVMNHQQLLPYVDESEARHLVNIDYHSDLNNITVKELHCGSWVSYVKWRAEGKYTWIRPEKDPSMGRCDSAGSRWNSFTDWRYTSSIIEIPYKFRLNKFLPNCAGIGLCMSPAFISQPMREFFLELVRLCEIPYEPGDPSELFSEPKIPPGLEEAHAHVCHIPY